METLFLAKNILLNTNIYFYVHFINLDWTNIKHFDQENSTKGISIKKINFSVYSLITKQSEGTKHMSACEHEKYDRTYVTLFHKIGGWDANLLFEIEKITFKCV